MSGHVTDCLSAYLDGALDARDLERVQAHVEACPNCLREYEDLRALRGLLRGMRTPDPAAGFADRIHWRLTREALRRRPITVGGLLSARPLPLRVAVVCATVLLLVGLPFGWLSGWLGGRETPLDMDTYLRHYLILSADRSLSDEAAATLVASDVTAPEPPPR